MKTTSYTERRSPTWRRFPIDLLSRSPIAHWAPVPLRLIVGYGFMEHGYAKLARGLDAFPAILQALGVPAPHLMGWLTILVEIIGGLAVLFGALVPLASIPMAAVLLVAMITVHLPYGFSSIKLQAVTAAGAQFGPPGYETDLLYLACLAALVLGGSGPLAIELFWQSAEKSRVLPRTPEPFAGSRRAGGADGSEAQGEVAESHAPGPDTAAAARGGPISCTS
jgi:putative oxidoreductase